MRERTPRKVKIPVKERKHGFFEPSIRRLFVPQLVFGLIFTIICFYLGYYHGGYILSSESRSHDLHFRLFYALRCTFPMLLSLFVGIMVTMVKRRLSVAVNPLSGHENLVLIDKNYLTNTVEQLVLGVMLMLITATYTDSPQVLRLLPIYSILFVIGRVLFRIGYRKTNHCAYRETGMSMNLSSTIIMIGMVAYYFCMKGLSTGIGY